MRSKYFARAVAIIAVIAAALFIISHAGWRLVIRDGQTGRAYASYPVKEGESFGLGFIHSVNKSPLIDVFYIEDKEIWEEETIYYSFGAGVQTELNPGERLDYGEDGAMIISDIHKQFPNGSLVCSVGVASDRTLLLGDVRDGYLEVVDEVGVYPEDRGPAADSNRVEVISLSALCGKKQSCHSTMSGVCSIKGQAMKKGGEDFG